jgi:hypothetical protein
MCVVGHEISLKDSRKTTNSIQVPAKRQNKFATFVILFQSVWAHETWIKETYCYSLLETHAITSGWLVAPNIQRKSQKERLTVDGNHCHRTFQSMGLLPT